MNDARPFRLPEARGEGSAATGLVKLAILAVGGQGGGVLTNWIVGLAERGGYHAQATSVAGVAQRTGSTIYYVEMAPAGGRVPVFALSPSPGDVDIVIAAELMEAGRAVMRGFVTPDRTTLIASTHRILAVSEKVVPGDGRLGGAPVLEEAQRNAHRALFADLEAAAAGAGSVISASLFGALAGSGALPFARELFEETVREGRRGVEANLRAFAAGFAQVAARAPGETPGGREGLDGSAALGERDAGPVSEVPPSAVGGPASPATPVPADRRAGPAPGRTAVLSGGPGEGPQAPAGESAATAAEIPAAGSAALPEARLPATGAPASEPAEAPAEPAGPAPALAAWRALARRVDAMPAPVREMARRGLAKVVDYQDARYGAEYLDALDRALALDGEAQGWELAREAAKVLANAFCYDDVIRVADLKTRASREARLRREQGVGEEAVVQVTEYFHPRAEELCGLLPARLGAWVEGRPRLVAWIDRRVNRGRRLRTDALAGFLPLWVVAGLRPVRRRLLRHRVETAHREGWFGLALRESRTDHALGVEVLRCQRLVKGYADTHARGLSKHARVIGAVDMLRGRPDAADWLRRLRTAALRDERGEALDGALRTVASLDRAVGPVSPQG